METGHFLSAIVLAGGQSRRMGQDKALISVQGTPMLQRVCQVALQCTPQVYVVARSIERYQAIVPSGCQLIPEQQLSNEIQPQGPLVGFAQGLAQVDADWVLLLACDLPNLEAHVLQNWAKECHGASEVMALLPRYNSDTWEALCGFYCTACLGPLQAAIAEGERSFQGWLRSLSVKELLVPDAQMLLNCNTPDDLVGVKQRVDGAGGESQEAETGMVEKS